MSLFLAVIPCGNFCICPLFKPKKIVYNIYNYTALPARCPAAARPGAGLANKRRFGL